MHIPSSQSRDLIQSYQIWQDDLSRRGNVLGVNCVIGRPSAMSLCVDVLDSPLHNWCPNKWIHCPSRSAHNEHGILPPATKHPQIPGDAHRNSAPVSGMRSGSIPPVYHSRRFSLSYKLSNVNLCISVANPDKVSN